MLFFFLVECVFACVYVWIALKSNVWRLVGDSRIEGQTHGCYCNTSRQASNQANNQAFHICFRSDSSWFIAIHFIHGMAGIRLRHWSTIHEVIIWLRMLPIDFQMPLLGPLSSMRSIRNHRFVCLWELKCSWDRPRYWPLRWITTGTPRPVSSRNHSNN